MSDPPELKAKICKYEGHHLRIESKKEIASLCFLHPASLRVCEGGERGVAGY